MGVEGSCAYRSLWDDGCGGGLTPDGREGRTPLVSLALAGQFVMSPPHLYRLRLNLALNEVRERDYDTNFCNSYLSHSSQVL